MHSCCGAKYPIERLKEGDFTANFVITTHWTDGDVLPFIHIGKMLVKRGHRVTLLSHCCYEQLALDAGLRFTAWETPEQYAEFIENLNAKIDSVKSLDALEAFRFKYESIEIRLKEYEKIIRHCDRPDTVVVAKNRSSLAAYLAAEKCDLPIACIFMNPHEIHSMITFNNLFADKLKREANLLRSELNLPPVKSWLDWQSSPEMNIALWPEWFAPAGSGWRKEIVNAGFPLPDNKTATPKPLPPDMQIFNDVNEMPILITGGTGRMIKPEFYPVSAEACRLSGKNAILLTRYEEMVPSDLPPSIRWVKHIANLGSVMHAMGAVIHHGGIGTLSGAAMAGTPQLILGHYVDRPLNGARAKELGIAEFIPPALWDPEILAQSISNITSPSFREACRAFASRLNKQENGLQHTCAMLEEMVDNQQYRIDVPVDSPEQGTQTNESTWQQRLTSLSDTKRAILLKSLQARIDKE